MTSLLPLQKYPGLNRIGEWLLIVICVGGLLWLVHTEHTALHITNRWVDTHIATGAAAETDREQLQAAYRAAYTWQDAAGKQTTYPVSRDSYYFLRLARNIIETGSPCSVGSPAGSCQDMQVNPVAGRPLANARSPHPWGIALVYRMLAVTGAEPSLLRAGLLHNRLMLFVCGLLAYLLVRNLAPDAPRSSGLAAAVMMILTPAVVQRSFGVDNDVWILALMLGGILATGQFLKKVVSGTWNVFLLVVAIVTPVLLYATWGGWIFLLVLQCAAAVLAIAVVIVRGSNRKTHSGSVNRTVFIFGSLSCVFIAVMLLLWFGGNNAAGPAITGALPAPDVFGSVAELAPIDINRVMAGFTWPVLMAAVTGLIAALWRLGQWKKSEFPATLLLILGWFTGAVYLLFTMRYERFLFLMAPPVALFAGLGIGALPAILPRPALRPVIAAGLALLLITSVTVNAVNLVRDNRPQLNTAWVSVLDTLSQTTPADAIVVGWWNTGHWITYWARRATAVDGASLQSPRVNDVGRLLATDREGNLDTLVNLAACGNESDCQRPVYLLTSADLLHESAWMISGFWQGSRAALVDRVIANEVPIDVPADLLSAARNIDTPIERSLFAAPDAQIWSTGWSPCRVAGDSSVDCLLGVTSKDGWLIERLVVPAGRINEAYMVLRRESAEAAVLLPPSLIRLATQDQLLDVTIDTSTSNPGILLDTVAHRAFLGTPAMLHSLVTRLVLLEGRYEEGRFEQVVSATTVDGHQVSAWRVIRN
jgi:hypothetical protein